MYVSVFFYFSFSKFQKGLHLGHVVNNCHSCLCFYSCGSCPSSHLNRTGTTPHSCAIQCVAIWAHSFLNKLKSHRARQRSLGTFFGATLRPDHMVILYHAIQCRQNCTAYAMCLGCHLLCIDTRSGSHIQCDCSVVQETCRNHCGCTAFLWT